VIYASSTKSSNAEHITYQSYRIFYKIVQGTSFFTKFNISMQYYAFEIDDVSEDFFAIIMPFGKYKYTQLPMGLKCSPDIAQSKMESVLSGIDDADV
jgi:hypothetical protein